MARDGAERVISYIANYYAEKGYKVDIIVLLLTKCGYDLHPNVRIVSFVRDKKYRFQNIFYWIKNIRKYIIETNPVRIISFSMYVNIFTLIACIGLKKDILISERNDPSSDGRRLLDRMLTKVLYPYASKIVFQTKRAQKCFSMKIQNRSKIIGNPISVYCEASDLKDDKIVTVGRLELQKNHLLLLRAFAILLKKYPNLKLEIYGTGSLLNKLNLECKNLGICQNVFFMGNRSNIHSFLKDAKAFILSSDFEGLSNALLEAMMMGLPCVSTNCAGSDEVIINGVNGLITPIGQAKEMADAIDRILTDGDFAKRIGKNAKESMSSFKSDIVIEQWVKYIEN